jgi:hypothetical protein
LLLFASVGGLELNQRVSVVSYVHLGPTRLHGIAAASRRFILLNIQFSMLDDI